jgi:short subunit dehydrogenase-like uncharacterized protein
MALRLRAFTGAMAFTPTRRALNRCLPAPGAGPSTSTQRAGWFHSKVTARTEDGHGYQAIAAGPGDPGYAATAVMAGERGSLHLGLAQVLVHRFPADLTYPSAAVDDGTP